jgi:hypothetical protein
MASMINNKMISVPISWNRWRSHSCRTDEREVIARMMAAMAVSRSAAMVVLGHPGGLLAHRSHRLPNPPLRAGLNRSVDVGWGIDVG